MSQTQISVSLFLQPDGVNLLYFKLRILDLTEFIELKYLTSIALGCQDKVIEVRVCGKNFAVLFRKRDSFHI